MLGTRGRGPAERAALQRAAARLAAAGLPGEPLELARVRLVVVPWAFQLPWIRRFDGYAIWHLILLRDPALLGDDGLVAHELCHVWQQQRGWLRMWLSYLRHGYEHNPYEAEARRVAALTRRD